MIKDQKTGESLQYAFIEFDKVGLRDQTFNENFSDPTFHIGVNLRFFQPEECENAYFKMDNVLIDDRRIHVDFSQSVSKLQGNKWARSECSQQ